MTPRADLTIRPEAIEEIRAARDWYRSRDANAARSFLLELEHAVIVLLAVPRAGKSHPRLRTRTLPLRRFPFVFVYRLRRPVAGREQVELIALAHTSREPGYWRGRLR